MRPSSARAPSIVCSHSSEGAAAELQTVALGGVAALCEHAAVSRVSPSAACCRRCCRSRAARSRSEGSRRCVGTFCARSGRSVGNGRSNAHSSKAKGCRRRCCRSAAAAHVAEQKAARRPLRLLRVPHARALACSRRPRTRALRSRCESEDATVRCAAAVAVSSPPTPSPRSTRASRREIRGRRWRRRRRGCRRAAAARSAVAVQALAAQRRRGRPTAVRRRRMAAGRRRPSGRARLGAGGRGARDEGGGCQRCRPFDGGAALGVPHTGLRADDDGDEAADLDREIAAPPPPRPLTAAAAAAAARVQLQHGAATKPLPERDALVAPGRRAPPMPPGSPRRREGHAAAPSPPSAPLFDVIAPAPPPFLVSAHTSNRSRWPPATAAVAAPARSRSSSTAGLPVLEFAFHAGSRRNSGPMAPSSSSRNGR